MVRSTRAKRTAASRTVGPAARRRRSGIQRLGFAWRWISAAILGVTIATMSFIIFHPMFVVQRAEIGGLRYMPIEEAFTESGVAGKHILLIDPGEAEAALEASPSLESADVVLGWPARVLIRVREREPALIWEQSGRQYWVDLNGHLMVLRRDLPNLLLVVNEGDEIPFQCPGPSCAQQDEITIDPEVVWGAQHLKTLRGNIDVLYYDPVQGLSYQDGRGWRGYFGVGTDMDRKLIVYETLIASLELRGIHPVYIDVSNPDAPYYRMIQ